MQNAEVQCGGSGCAGRFVGRGKTDAIADCGLRIADWKAGRSGGGELAGAMW